MTRSHIERFQHGKALLGLFSSELRKVYKFQIPIFPLFYTQEKGNIVMSDSIAKAYPYANTNKPQEYYDYEALEVIWG